MIHFRQCPVQRQWVSHRVLVARLVASFIAAPGTLLVVPCAIAQAVYSTPDAAVTALVDALSHSDPGALKHVLGNDFERFIPTQAIGHDDIYDFLGAWSQGHEIVMDPSAGSRHRAHLRVGESGWTLPIPLIEGTHGWRFDPAAAKDEMLTLRIGRNERAAMLTSLAYLDAQNDYRNLTGHYARRLVSTPGHHDGLYWPAAPDEAQSPLGPLVTVMRQDSPISADGYHGYRFRILSRQGNHASGGAANYVQDGVMTKGCALIAWPARYGSTGVMSFIVNQDGQIYQKDLGPHTERTALALGAFDPDPSWRLVRP
ncbi:DUF2950 domain-containing protein [Paraburkholderia sp. LEh10]|uniref:DUF2950 domain-containing protein n=1 Tax=Paraburkholderia sp. LEh10 TaxID=2821353 RepID=UPI001AEB2320|nr:DUF2950 domain-containing protein [Paraburkholderia sp. LEh10]MBP0590764.1 DUF2950 domain-containing protein [Paraburkholderia sp. LEh10]